MIKYGELRKAVVKGLYDHLNNGQQGEESENVTHVIMANQFHPKPGYPYVTYTFTTPMTGAWPRPAAYTVEENPEAETVKYHRDSLQEMTLSLTAISMDTDEAHEIALDAAAWFTWLGWLYLKGHEIVVVRVEALSNRDTLIVDDYERRVGFDVRLRARSKITKEIERIEKADISYKESENA